MNQEERKYRLVKEKEATGVLKQLLDKELLLKDLSGRLPYKVKGQFKEKDFVTDEVLIEAVGINPDGW